MKTNERTEKNKKRKNNTKTYKKRKRNVRKEDDTP